MSSRPALWAAVLGVASGFLGGFAGARLLPAPGGDASGLRADLARQAEESLAARAATASALVALSERMAALETHVRTSGGLDADSVAAAVRGASEDLAALRDAVARDLGHADGRLAELERRVDQLMALVSLAPPPGVRRAPTEEDEAAWLALARDADPLRRFSAMAMLGRVRSDRSVRASVEALHDPEELVVWQAARNLGEFRDRSAARELAALLRHDRATVRSAAYEALRRLGAPDAKFVASDLADARRAPTELLERWASETQ